jgi:NAD(P)-dependent dehydrogenase (short-subunit alcohol dehydrogenase family)
MSKPVCVVVGAGPGNGAAIGARFAAGGYTVALCARDAARLNRIASGIEGASAFTCDVRDPESVAGILNQIAEEFGSLNVLVYNAGAGAFASIDDATLEQFQAAWEVNTRGLFLATKAALPHLRACGGGSIVVIGATASVKGGADFVPFASAKAGQRGLAQSLARYLGPEGIHVSYLVLDGIVNLPVTRERMPDHPDQFFMEPAQIADTVFFLARQPTQAWTFELDLRPFGEKW